jgi:hypothetical protein
VAVGLAISACGSSGSAPMLNTEQIERAIEQSSLAQRGAHVQVSCPPRVRRQQGLVFSCTAVLGHSSTRFVVTELNGSGHVRYEAR